MNLRKFSVATFNLYNLNEPGLPIYTDRDGWSQDDYDRKIAWTAQQLQWMQSDLFGLQELWHVDSLTRALAQAGLTDVYDTVVPPATRGGKIVCAALVRKGLLVGEPEWIEHFPEKFELRAQGDDPQTPTMAVNIQGFSRPVLHFTLSLREGAPLTHVYVCHFKSKGPTRIQSEVWYKANKSAYAKHATGLGAALSTVRRTAEAAALRFILTEQMQNTATPTLVLGDINDGQHSNTANILTGQPRYLVGDSVGGGDTALYTAQTLQEYRDTRDVYYTHIHQDIRESLDQILVSQEFYDNSRVRVWQFGGMTINNDHLNVDDHKTSGTGDHGIVRVSFNYKPAKSV